MYGDLGTKLAHHAKRTRTLPALPPYQTELVRSIVREVRALDADTQAALAPYNGSFDPSSDPGTACSLLVNHLAMRRNKRCLLAYHRIRAQRIEQDIWAGRDPGETEGIGAGEHAATVEAGSSVAGSNLSPEEEEYARQYADLLAVFKGQWADVDLTGSLEPPRELFIDVRVLKDAGVVEMEYGTINLTKNSQFYVRHADVERLIAQGYLEKLG